MIQSDCNLDNMFILQPALCMVEGYKNYETMAKIKIVFVKMTL